MLYSIQWEHFIRRRFRSVTQALFLVVLLSTSLFPPKSRQIDQKTCHKQNRFQSFCYSMKGAKVVWISSRTNHYSLSLSLWSCLNITDVTLSLVVVVVMSTLSVFGQKKWAAWGGFRVPFCKQFLTFSKRNPTAIASQSVSAGRPRSNKTPHIASKWLVTLFAVSVESNS